jgi:hypothetical protein
MTDYDLDGNSELFYARYNADRKNICIFISFEGLLPTQEKDAFKVRLNAIWRPPTPAFVYHEYDYSGHSPGAHVLELEYVADDLPHWEDGWHAKFTASVLAAAEFGAHYLWVNDELGGPIPPRIPGFDASYTEFAMWASDGDRCWIADQPSQNVAEDWGRIGITASVPEMELTVSVSEQDLVEEILDLLRLQKHLTNAWAVRFGNTVEVPQSLRSGNIAADRIVWRYRKHGSGVEFIRSSDGLRVDIHDNFECPDSFDEWRLEIFLESRGLSFPENMLAAMLSDCSKVYRDDNCKYRII